VRSIRLGTVIAAPIGDCFDLSLSDGAHAASMRASGGQAIGGVARGVMKPGDTVTWRARHFGIAFRMTSAITEYQYPDRFVDEQQRGPFRQWWHEHTVTTMANGHTQMIDVVQFPGPARPAGVHSRPSGPRSLHALPASPAQRVAEDRPGSAQLATPAHARARRGWRMAGPVRARHARQTLTLRVWDRSGWARRRGRTGR